MNIIIIILIAAVIFVLGKVDPSAATPNRRSDNIPRSRGRRARQQSRNETTENWENIRNRYDRVWTGDESAESTTPPTFAFTGTIPSERPRIPVTPAPGRPLLTKIYNTREGQKHLVNYILAHVLGTVEDTYVYFISDSNLLPFSVSDRSRMFTLDECYLIILKETCDGSDQWNIYYIIGMNSDDDARSTAAEYTMLLHNKLKALNTSFVYRKYETFSYKKIIENAKTYLPRKNVITMYLITENRVIENKNKDIENKNKDTEDKNKDTANIIAKRVLPNPNYFKADSCVVLSVHRNNGKSKIIQACGPKVKSAVQVRAAKLAHLLNGRSTQSIQTTTEFSTIMIELGIDATLEEDVDRDGPPALFKFNKFKKGAHRVAIPERVEFLDGRACYMLDSKNYSGVFFWIGSQAPVRVQTHGIENMENYINIDLKLPHAQVTIMGQGKETTDFLLSFPKWYT